MSLPLVEDEPDDDDEEDEVEDEVDEESSSAAAAICVKSTMNVSSRDLQDKSSSIYCYLHREAKHSCAALQTKMETTPNA